MKNRFPMAAMQIGLAIAALATVLSPASVTAQSTPPAHPSAQQQSTPADGVIRIRSAHGFDETIRLIRADIAEKGIRFFDAIDQAELAASASLSLNRSTLLLFGNPPLGIQFLQSNPYAGLDWPVRMLILEDENGAVWVAWTDFSYIAERYGITDRGPQIAMASEVSASIASSAAH